jgi:hypothetical protein
MQTDAGSPLLFALHRHVIILAVPQLQSEPGCCRQDAQQSSTLAITHTRQDLHDDAVSRLTSARAARLPRTGRHGRASAAGLL